MNQTAAALLIFTLLLLLSSCGKNEIKNPTASYDYNYVNTAPNAEASSGAGNTNNVSGGAVTIDTSWHNNYRLTFDYFIQGTTDTTVSVSEKKTSTMYVTTDSSEGLILYYLQNGSDVDYYRIYSDNITQQHTVYKNHTVAAIKSRFMSMSEADEDFASKPNSAYAGESAVAGREAKLFIQRGYKDGELTATAYYYIDTQYGFCSKAQVFDANEQLTISWELTSFSSGTVTNDDISVDLSVYSFAN